MEVKTIGDCFRARQDNFVLLRVLAASFVIYGHSFALSNIRGYKGFVTEYVGGTHIAHEAVSIFFVVSGFLVTASYLNRHDWRVFVKSRLLRIVPALIGCLFITVFVFGPILSTVSYGEYFSDMRTYTYLLWNASFAKPVFTLPGVFESNHFKGAVNGSLWTLPAEMRMYIIVLVLGVLGILRRRSLFNVVIFGLFFVGVFFPEYLPLVNQNPKYFRLAAMFALGALMYVNRDTIPLHGSIVFMLFILTVLFHQSEKFMIVLSLFLAYGAIWFAYAPTIPFVEKMHDNSYGIYIYAFPIQQALVNYFPEISPYPLFVASFILTFVAASLSWFYIEKPALSLKKKNLLESVFQLTGMAFILSKVVSDTGKAKR